MTGFSGACSVTSCRFNLGGGRVSCDWLRGGRGRCHHHAYREAWTAGHELEQAQEMEAGTILAVAPLKMLSNVGIQDAQETEAEPIPTATAQTVVAGCEKMQEPPARPLSMTSRATAASTPMDAARARQMLFDLGEV